MEFKDFSFNISEYGGTETLTGNNAVIYAIKNIILARPGNFPFHPEIGVNIGKYKFDILDDITIKSIQSDIIKQVSKAIPTIDSINIIVQKVEDDINGEHITALGIAVSALENGEKIEGTFLIRNDHDVISIFNETK